MAGDEDTVGPACSAGEAKAVPVRARKTAPPSSRMWWTGRMAGGTFWEKTRPSRWPRSPERPRFAEHIIAFVDDQSSGRAEVAHRPPGVCCRPADRSRDLAGFEVPDEEILRALDPRMTTVRAGDMTFVEADPAVGFDDERLDALRARHTSPPARRGRRLVDGRPS